LEPKLEIKDLTYDIRNPYFVIDGKDLFVWVSAYKYQLDSGFYKSRLYKIAQSCKKLLPANLLEENDFSVVYAPTTLHTGSFSKFLSGKGWLVSPNSKLNNSYLFGDEEMALVFDKKSYRNFGLIRNKPEDGLPLEYVEFSESWNLIARSSWCNGVTNSQLVSPKIYKIDNKFLVLYTQRQRLAQNFQAKLIIKVFSSVDKMLACQQDEVHEKILGNNWDAGYPSVVKTSAGIRVFWYATKDALTRIYSASFPFN